MAAAAATVGAAAFPRSRRSFSSSPERCLRCWCAHSAKTSTVASAEIHPVLRSVTAFAPATIANFGPGFDFLGCAVDAGGLGDTVTVAVDPSAPAGSVTISCISASDPTVAVRLSRQPDRNCASIAALAVLRLLGASSAAISIHLSKGLPLGSGLGSSAASAAAAAVAVNELFGRRLTRADLVLAGLESESAVSGYHADNIAPAILGGFVLIRSYDPFDLLPLEFPTNRELGLVLVTPEFEAPTKKMRAALPSEISMKDHIGNSSQGAALAAAIVSGNVAVLGSAMSADSIVEPRRAPLIPGMAAVKEAALAAGALGCTISGAGPTAVAVIEGEEDGVPIGESMVKAFLKEGGLRARSMVGKLDRLGARVVSMEL